MMLMSLVTVANVILMDDHPVNIIPKTNMDKVRRTLMTSIVSFFWTFQIQFASLLFHIANK